jgi:GMP synthase-like glutamine amidotransferase
VQNSGIKHPLTTRHAAQAIFVAEEHLMERILFLDNAIENDTYNALGYWKPLLLFPFDSFRVAAGQWPSDLSIYSHILITGSSACVLEDTDWMQAEVELIRSAADMGKVILGSCFGHQIIARSLFGLDAVRQRQKPEIGWPDIEIIADDPLLGKAGHRINAFVFHYDEVRNVPQNHATVIARSEECDILGFKLIDKPVWGVQPHFEMGIVEGLDCLDTVSAEHIPQRQSFFSTHDSLPKDSGRIAPLMKAFHETKPGG